MGIATADLYDEFGESLRIVAPLFRDYGAIVCFAGPVSTCKCFEDNSYVRAALEEPGNGRVLVVDGGGSLRCALVGDKLAALGERNGWAGIVVYGCIRDAESIGKIQMGVKALATNPRKSVKRDVGERDIALRFGEVVIDVNDYLYADADGVVLSESKLA